MKFIATRLLALFTVMALSGCAALNLAVEQPDISVNSFKILPGDSINPTFEIGLRVVNPNGIALNLKGLSYSASIDGHKVFAGVASQLPSIPAYGEEEVKLRAQADLFGSLRLISDLMKPRTEPLGYKLKVKLDVSNLPLPINVTREGNLTMPGST